LGSSVPDETASCTHIRTWQRVTGAGAHESPSIGSVISTPPPSHMPPRSEAVWKRRHSPRSRCPCPRHVAAAHLLGVGLVGLKERRRRLRLALPAHAVTCAGPEFVQRVRAVFKVEKYTIRSRCSWRSPPQSLPPLAFLASCYCASLARKSRHCRCPSSLPIISGPRRGSQHGGHG
jgi:hypothetical protein